jgi:tetratricopeptide (TPR) repeat protein
MADASDWTAILRPFRDPSRRNALILATVALGALGFLPQLGGPGYDAALVSGLVLPGVAATAAALEHSVTATRPSTAVARGATLGVVLGVVGFAVVLVHGARVGFCDPREGLWLYVLGPGFGAALGGVWGALMGLVTARVTRGRGRAVRRLVATGLALLGPLACIGVSFYRFVTSPMVFAFDPFFGVFAGPLYDTVVSVVDRLLSYRQGTVATLMAVTLGASLFDRVPAEGLRAVLLARPGTAVLALGAALLSLIHSASGPRLGHWSTASSIEEALGGHYLGKRCDVVHARAMSERDVALFTRDCDASVAQVERYFGAPGPEHVRVFLFSNEGEKGWLMGASHTYIAKPWRREVYVQQAPYPHPVIAHELAHVIAGSFASGPFRVAGPLGGWLPDPGRIEGFAVAAAPDETDELTDLEWAATMQKLGILPPLRSVFQLEFLGITASKAYTVAGAFVAFMRDRYGAPALRRWYAGATLPEVTGGKDLGALDVDFRKALVALTVTSRAEGTAKVRFERAPFFARRCPRIVDRTLVDAGARLGVGDVSGAELGYREALALDPRNLEARFGLAGCEHRRGNTDGAVAQYLALGARGDLLQIQVSHALESAADLALSEGHSAQARELYARTLELTFDEDRRRTLEVKRWACGTAAESAIVALLIGSRDTAPGWESAAPRLQAWSDREFLNDLPTYLIGRNLLNGGHYADAAAYLDVALRRASPLASVHREAVRLRVITACALGEDPRRLGLVEEIEKDPELAPARRDGLLRLVERCAGPAAAVKR